MWAVVLGVCLGSPPEPSGAVGLEWYDEEGVSAELAERLRRSVAEARGIAASDVIVDAAAAARQVVSFELPRAVLDLQVENRERLRAADEAFRAARIDEARKAIADVLASLERHPYLPGAWSSAWSAHVLDAQVAFAAKDKKGADESLRAALRLAPRARLSPRRVRPELIARHEALQRELLAGEPKWTTPAIELPDGEGEIEIDGESGVRALPPGRHFVVHRRPGHAPLAAFVDAAGSWIVPDARPALAAETPRERVDAERVCEALDLDLLVLAKAGEDDRVGLQTFRCGEGFGPRWIGRSESLPTGVELGFEGPFGGTQATLDSPWPGTVRAPEPEKPPPPKPWYKRAWVWILVGGVVAGAVTTGVVLGTRDQPTPVEIDANDFLE